MTSDQAATLQGKMRRDMGYVGFGLGSDAEWADDLREGIHETGKDFYLIEKKDGELVGAHVCEARLGGERRGEDLGRLVGYSAKVEVGDLGDVSFCRDHGIQYAYMLGAMANGIASVELVEAAAVGGMLGSYGAAGQSIGVIGDAVDRLNKMGKPFCVNLIHSPSEPEHESRVVDLLIKKSVNLIEASAYLDLNIHVVRYRLAGMYRGADGVVVTPNQIIAKVSRVEVASKWFAPAPMKFVEKLLADGLITQAQAEMSQEVPMAYDLTAEADSGGHTDNRPFITLLPTMLALRDAFAKKHGYEKALRVGVGGGISTPTSAAAAFMMGAGFIVTGSVNQACLESGSSGVVREMLTQTGQADVTMAPAADMFEMGVKLQVIKRGTMFAMRANKLYELYRAHGSIETIPAKDRASIEKTIFRMSLDEVWGITKTFFLEREPKQVAKAERDAKHKMALVFRWYLGLSSRWANAGEVGREADYQIWAGPAMGAFNQWVKGSYLEEAGNRKAVSVAREILYGATVVLRLGILRSQGVSLAQDWVDVLPAGEEKLERVFA